MSKHWKYLCTIPSVVHICCSKCDHVRMMESELFKQFFAAQLCGMKEEMSMLREMQSDNQRELHVIQQQQQVIHQQNSIPHICHKVHMQDMWRKICHVEKFQISIHGKWGEI